MTLKRLAVAAGAMLLALLAGCANSPGLDYWYVDSLTKVFPDDPVGKNRLSPAAFHAARNANMSIQLALRARRAVGDIHAEVLPLSGPGVPIDTATVRWTEYVVVTSNTRNTPPEELVREAPALFPDALLDEFPVTVPKDETRTLWITIHVPANQEPGEYQGQIRLRQGGDELARVPFVLTVYRAAVPSPIPLAITNFLNLSDHHIEQFYGLSRSSGPWWDFIRNIAGLRAHPLRRGSAGWPGPMSDDTSPGSRRCCG